MDAHPAIIIEKSNEAYELLKWNGNDKYEKVISNADMRAFLQSKEFNNIMANKKEDECINYNGLSSDDMNKISQMMRWFTKKPGKFS